MGEKLLVGLAQGDINGIGYELLIKVLSDNKLCDVCVPLLLGSSKVAGYYRKSVENEEEPINLSLNLIQKPEDASDKRCNVINTVSDDVIVEPGIETKVSDEAAMLSLRQGFDYLDNNRIDVLVGAPMGDFAFDLEKATSLVHYLANRYESDFLLPLCVGQHIKLAFLSSGKDIKDALNKLTIPNVVRRITMLNRALIRDFAMDKPRIAVLALNTSVGDGIFGEEEDKVLLPAIDELRAKGIFAVGPYAADRFFSERCYEKFDAVLALHNDQGMIPFKVIENNSGVLLISGLPAVFTTTIHGMAYDIVEKNRADYSGLSNAIYTAIDVYKNRAQYAKLTANPLRSYDVGGDRRESDLNVEQIAGVKDN